MSARPEATRKRVLIIEPQALFGPYLAAAIGATGCDVVGVEPAVRAGVLRRLQPDIVVLDASCVRAPLACLRALRTRLPVAHLVLYAPSADPAWTLLARGLGADAVIGPRADEPELVAALAA